MVTEKAEMSFLEHLGVLRGHLIRSVIAVLVLTVLAFLNKSFLFDRLLLASKEPDFITYRALCRVSEWFNLNSDSPYMLMVANVKSNKRIEITFLTLEKVPLISQDLGSV